MLYDQEVSILIPMLFLQFLYLPLDRPSSPPKKTPHGADLEWFSASN